MKLNSTRLAFALCLALVAMAAFGATGAFAGTVSSQGLSISYTGTNVPLSIANNGLAYTLTDTSSAGVTAGSGCTQYSATQVNCPTGGVNQITVPASVIASSIPSTTRVTTSSCNLSSSSPGPVVVNCDSTGATDQDWFSISTGSGPDQINAGPNWIGTIATGAQTDMINVNTSFALSDCPGEQQGCSSVTGGADDDVIDASASTGDVYYETSTGDDYFSGGSGNDQVVVGYGPDGHDVLFGGAGNDKFYDYVANSGTGEDLNDGYDYVYGGSGNDALTLSVNNFDHSAYEEGVRYQGGSGTDSFGYATSNSNGDHPVTVSLDGLSNDGPISSGTLTREGDNPAMSVENIIPNFIGMTMSGNDVLVGSGDNNLIRGQGGNDTITGNAGTDTIYGDGGDDTIYATDGEADTVNCGTGTNDTVDADAIGIDTVNADCENVTRH